MENSHEEADYTGAKLGMWLFIFTEACFFFAPLMLFFVYFFKNRAQFHEASASLDVGIGTLNTIVLLTSSLTAALSVAAFEKNRKSFGLAFIAATIFFGGVFIFNKYFEWAGKFAHGVYPGGSGVSGAGDGLFWGLYFFTTGLHGLHVLAGMIVFIILAVSVKRCGGNFVRFENAALYWHLVDMVWIFLFPLFYLIS